MKTILSLKIYLLKNQEKMKEIEEKEDGEEDKINKEEDIKGKKVDSIKTMKENGEIKGKETSKCQDHHHLRHHHPLIQT